MDKYKVGIIGVGMVGGSLAKYFKEKDNYDLFKPGVGCDLSIIEAVLSDLTVKDRIIILKSTVAPGTTDTLQKKYPEHKFMFNPEFLTEETADNDMCFPDRQVIGYTKESYSIAKDVLLQLPLAPYERIVPAKVAEMLKYAGNTWFSVKVAKNNELYILAMRSGFTIDEWEQVVSGMAADKRIGRTHLTIYHKGFRGYGGKCLPKDAKQLLEFAKQNGVEMPVLKATDAFNDELLRSQGLPEYS